MIIFVIMIFAGIVMISYGIYLLNNIKEDDESKYFKRFGYSAVITVGIILLGLSFWEIVLYNRLNPLRRIPMPPTPPSRFSTFASPINRTANV